MKLTSKMCLLAVLLFMIVTIPVHAEPLKGEEPIVVTTCGQSPGALMAAQIARRLGLQVQQEDLLTAGFLREKAEAGEGFKTIIITMGTSGKGLGAAGIDMRDEEERINSILDEAEAQGMLIIGAHIEGAPRRVDAADERSIQIVAPHSHVLVAHKDSNKDGYFTNLGTEKEIPVYIIEATLQMTQPLKALFELE